ncbi:hypothetical protein QAD02_006340, partial [Eretmocerus hayati]
GNFSSFCISPRLELWDSRKKERPSMMRVLLISIVFFAPILAAPRADQDHLEKIKDNEGKLTKQLSDLLEILGEDGFSKYEKADYTGAVESGSRHNGKTVNEIIKRLVTMFYENMKPLFAFNPGMLMESCLKELKES